MFEFTGEEPHNNESAMEVATGIGVAKGMDGSSQLIESGNPKNIEGANMVPGDSLPQLRKVQKNLQFSPEAHKMIKGMAPRSLEQLNDPAFQKTYQQAVDLYGLIHARFIQSKDGLNRMRKKFEAMEFGTCPRVQCN